MDRGDLGRSLAELCPGVVASVAVSELPRGVFQKPLRRLQAGELHALVALRIAPAFVVPLALERLEQDPFLSAAGHPGDLLTAILELPGAFWREEAELWARCAGLLEPVLADAAVRADAAGHSYLPQVLGDDFMAAVLHFRDSGPG